MQPWARLLMYYMKNGCTVSLNISLQVYFYSAKSKQQLLQALKLYNNCMDKVCIQNFNNAEEGSITQKYLANIFGH